MDYVITGNRRSQENPHFLRRTVLCILIIGEIVEHKGRFISDIVDGIFVICEESFWGVSAHSVCRNIPDGERSRSHIDLFAAETGALLAMACYMLKDELETYCPEIISRVNAELSVRIMEPYITRTDFFWMGYVYPVNNWNSWIISNILTVYLLFETDKEKLSHAVEKMMTEINRLYSSYPEDGGCDEGSSYWTVSGGSLYEFCNQLYVASGGSIDFFVDEKLCRIFRFIYRMYIGNGYFVNFADGMPKATHAMAGFLRIIGLARDMFDNDPEKSNITPLAERDAKIKRRLYDVIFKKDIVNSSGFVPPDTDILNELQVALIRENGWTVATKGGHNGENHNHNDVGSFIAYYESFPVLVDPSCGTYTKFSGGDTRYGIWTNRSDWHNFPKINGTLQQEGKEYKADSFCLDGKCITVSFAEAYPREAGVRQIIRNIIASNGSVLVDDDITLDGFGSVTENFITPLSVKLDGNRAVIDGRFVLACNIPAVITFDTVEFEEDERLTLFWKTEEMKRISFTFNGTDKVIAKFSLAKI